MLVHATAGERRRASKTPRSRGRRGRAEEGKGKGRGRRKEREARKGQKTKEKTSSLEGGNDIGALAALPFAREAVDGAL